MIRTPISIQQRVGSRDVILAIAYHWYIVHIIDGIIPWQKELNHWHQNRNHPNARIMDDLSKFIADHVKNTRLHGYSRSASR